MPGPVVYVAVGICAFAAAVAFKQFVYDPHIHPQLREWRDDMRERRRQRQRQRRLHEPVRAHSASHDSDRTPLRSPSVQSQHSSVELDDLVAREVQAWRTSVLTAEGGAGLRRRTVRSDGDNGDSGDSHDVLQQPMQPAANVEANVLFSYPASPTLDPARSPSPTTSSLTLGSASASNLTSSPLLSLRPPPPLHVPSDLHQPQAQSHTSAAYASHAPGPAQAPLRSSTSTPDTDLLSASVLTSADGFFTPASAASTRSAPTVAAGTLSPRDAEMLLSPGSPAAVPPYFVNPLSPSEFTDALSPRSASGAMSPFSDLPSPRSDPLSLDFDVPHAEEEDERFSVLTGASTPLSSDDFDAFSDAGQSWTDGAR